MHDYSNLKNLQDLDTKHKLTESQKHELKNLSNIKYEMSLKIKALETGLSNPNDLTMDQLSEKERFYSEYQTNQYKEKLILEDENCYLKSQIFSQNNKVSEYQRLYDGRFYVLNRTILNQREDTTKEQNVHDTEYEAQCYQKEHEYNNKVKSYEKNFEQYEILKEMRCKEYLAIEKHMEEHAIEIQGNLQRVAEEVMMSEYMKLEPKVKKLEEHIKAVDLRVQEVKNICIEFDGKNHEYSDAIQNDISTKKVENQKLNADFAILGLELQRTNEYIEYSIDEFEHCIIEKNKALGNLDILTNVKEDRQIQYDQNMCALISDNQLQLIEKAAELKRVDMISEELMERFDWVLRNAHIIENKKSAMISNVETGMASTLINTTNGNY